MIYLLSTVAFWAIVFLLTEIWHRKKMENGYEIYIEALRNERNLYMNRYLEVSDTLASQNNRVEGDEWKDG